MGAFMGMAGLHGMLRRTIYFDGEFRPYMVLAALSGALIIAGLVAFLVNIVMTVGLEGALGIFRRSRLSTKELVPAE
jgi:cytochrome c oxidase subunit 1